MSLQAAMHSLVGQIVGASETRRVAISSLQPQVARQRQEGRQHVHQLHQAHQRMAHDLRAALTLGERERRTQVQAWLGDVAGDRSAAGIEWRRLAATPQEKMVPEDKTLSSGQGHQGTHRQRQGGKARP